MSATDHRVDDDRPFDSMPVFDLAYLYDDAGSPSEVTVFATRPDADPVTHWITVDVDTAVPLEETR